MYAQRRDSNEPEIIESLEKLGAIVKQMDKSAGFDLLVFFNKNIHIVEVKNTNGKIKTRDKLIKLLTNNEYNTMIIIESSGVPYNIVTNIDEALKIVIGRTL